MEGEPVIAVKLKASEFRLIKEALSIASRDPEEIVSRRKRFERQVDEFVSKLPPDVVEELRRQAREAIADYEVEKQRRTTEYMLLESKLLSELWNQYGSKLLEEATKRRHPCEGCPEFWRCSMRDDEDAREDVCDRCPVCFREIGESRSDGSARCNWCGWS